MPYGRFIRFTSFIATAAILIPSFAVAQETTQKSKDQKPAAQEVDPLKRELTPAQKKANEKKFKGALCEKHYKNHLETMRRQYQRNKAKKAAAVR